VASSRWNRFLSPGVTFGFIARRKDIVHWMMSPCPLEGAYQKNQKTTS
jgi:hypothetical protein